MSQSYIQALIEVKMKKCNITTHNCDQELNLSQIAQKSSQKLENQHRKISDANQSRARFRINLPIGQQQPNL